MSFALLRETYPWNFLRHFPPGIHPIRSHEHAYQTYHIQSSSNQGHSIEANLDVKGNSLVLQPGSPYPLEEELRGDGNQPGCKRVQ